MNLDDEACPGDVVLENETVTGEELHTSCAAVQAGPAYTVGPGADVTLRAATKVVLKDGVSVGSGASFSAGTDASLSGDGTKSYAYQDYDYFLATATGPWGAKSWTYDRIGNRLTETDGDGTDGYHYEPNAAGGNTARLDSVDLPAASPRTYDYTPAGHQIQVAAGANVVDFTYDDAGRLSEASRESTTTPFLYDGRSFLRHAGDLASTGTVEPRYDSAGLLHALLRQPSTTDPETLYLVVSFAGRPVAQVALEAGQADRWWYFTTDHLGTPLVATDASGTELWHNRFEPFGRDMDAGLPWSALASEIFLRFPGQWEDTSWQGATLGAEVYYNVYRWYEVLSGRYTRVDPLPGSQDHAYAYAESEPMTATDPHGLFTVEGSAPECFVEYVRERLPNLIDHPTIPDDLSLVTGAAPRDIATGLSWGLGPTIVLRDIPSNPGRYAFGEWLPESPDQLNIQRDLVENLCECPCDEAVIGLGISILHEYAHKLHYDYRGREVGRDVGDRFTDRAYSPDVYWESLRTFYLGCGR